MKFQLMSITGLESAIASMKFTRRSWTPEWDAQMREKVHAMFTRDGFYNYQSSDGDARLWVNKQLEILRKIGCGYGDAWIDAGHETLLRFIDFEVIVTGLHSQGIADLDAHVMRMNNRMVRSSSRSGNATNTDELSDWYKSRVMTFDDLMRMLRGAKDENTDADLYDQFPNSINVTFNRDGKEVECVMIKTPHGYIREDLIDNGDAQRGLYHLGMSSNCIFKINFHDLRHVYKRRNEFTHAAPELAAGIEMLADQIEVALPTLGEMIRNDYCDDGELHHIMDISKHYTARPKTSSLINENAAKFG